MENRERERRETAAADFEFGTKLSRQYKSTGIALLITF